MKTIALLAAFTLLTPLLAAAADDSDTKVVVFNASVRVEVDDAGKPVKIEAPADLPEPIRSLIEERVGTWQYQPARVDGVAQAATTYVAVNACAVPFEGGYRLGLDFDGNGARAAGDKRLKPPTYPIKAEIGGTEAEFVLIIAIDVDGNASIEQVESVDISGRAGRNQFRPELERWVKTIRFDPEMVAGAPVPGQVRMPVNFMLRDLGNPQAIRNEFQAEAKASRECRIAGGEDRMKPMALKPVVSVTPSPAG